MKPHVVADVGNSRIKWGPCIGGRVTECVSLPPDDPDAWQRQLDVWAFRSPLVWAVAGVHPQRRDRLAEWLRQREDAVWVLDDWRRLPLEVRVDHPDKVGIDRLLNAVAAKSPVEHALSSILIDAGSAVTVDWLDHRGAFRGGAIFPGFRLMAQALHGYTALLPLVEIRQANPPLPGINTRAAIEAGVFWAVAGGIEAVVRQLTDRANADQEREVYLTGGDAALLAPILDTDYVLWPQMTLEGLRLTALAQR
jgi:type III pantothenate kinase